MVELIVTPDLALVSLIMAVLKGADVLYTVDPAYGVANAGFVNNAISTYQRIMVPQNKLSEARNLIRLALSSSPADSDDVEI